MDWEPSCSPEGGLNAENVPVDRLSDGLRGYLRGKPFRRYRDIRAIRHACGNRQFCERVEVNLSLGAIFARLHAVP